MEGARKARVLAKASLSRGLENECFNYVHCVAVLRAPQVIPTVGVPVKSCATGSPSWIYFRK